MPKTKIGIVDYLNARPLIYGLERERNLQIIRDVPSALCQRMQDGEIDVALVSSIECFRQTDFQILPDIGICSEGTIKSIKLYVHGEIKNVRRVGLDQSSRTAATMTRIAFLDFFEMEEIEFVDVPPTTDPGSVEGVDAVLMIGDTALKAKPGDLTVVDLGALWTERTGLPFVYAVWMCRKGAKVDQVLPQLLRARDRGLPERPKIAQQAAREMNLPAAGLSQYLTRNLRYQLGEREIKGLERFRDLAAEHELCEKRDVPFLRVKLQTA